MRLRNLFLTSTLAAAGIGAALFAQQPFPDQGDGVDEPGLAAARLSIINGDSSIRRGDSDDWVAGAVNAPLMSGDAFSVAPGGRSELQFDSANFLRVAGDSEVRLSDIENNRRAIQIARGVVTWRTLRDTSVDVELETQVAAVKPGRQSVVRLEVAPDGSTKVTVRRGDAEISTQRGGVQRFYEGQEAIVRTSGDVQSLGAGPRDEWDNWSDQRDSYLSRSQSSRYVPQEVYGTEDLDSYGRWDWDPQYGNVWAPTVAASWSPYHDGRWVWEDYYGWTWVDNAQWGWAPFHYGSWYQRANGWAWYPGVRSARTWWRPAMVGFFGFGGVGVGFEFGNVGWVPLAPYEVYRPWYGRGWYGGGRSFGNHINIVNNTNIVNVYRNARVNNGVTVIARSDFERGNFRNMGHGDQNQLQRASMFRGAVPLTPGTDHLRFSDRTVAARTPRADFNNQRFVSRAPQQQSPRVQRTPFAQQQESVRSSFNGGRGNAQANPQPNPQRTAPQGFQRFGGGQSEPAQRTAPAPAPSPMMNQAPQDNRAWRNFGSPRTPQQSQQTAPIQQAPAQRLDVAPSIMRQREAQQPQQQDRNRTFGTPQVQQPQYRQQTPQVQQAPPVRQAPAPQQQQAQPRTQEQRQQPSPRSQEQRQPSNGGNENRGNRPR